MKKKDQVIIMGKPSFKKRFRYWLDRRMAKGTASMVKLLLIMVLTAVIFVTILVVTFHLQKDSKPIIAIFWDNLRSAMSSSFPSSDSGSLLYIVLYTLLGLTGMVFTGMLIGIFSSAMRGKVIALQEDNPEIIEKGHTVILGFRIGEYALLNELIKSTEGERRTIVVVEDMKRQDMEQAIRNNVNVPRNIRLISIKADTTSPNALACCAIPDCSMLVLHTVDKGRTIKTLLAIEVLLMNSDKRPVIVASVDSKEEIFSKETLKERGISMLYSGNVIARIIAHSATQTGIYEALLDMIDYDNFEFYFESGKELAGMPFGKAMLAAKKAIIVGLYRNDKAIINPDKSETILEDDVLIVFEEEPGDLMVENIDDIAIPESKPLPVSEPIEEIAILGINQSILTILNELPDNIRQIKLIGINSHDKETYIPKDLELSSELIYDSRNTNKDLILAEMLKNTKHLCILADHKKKEEEADTDTMIRIIRLRNIKKRFNLNFTITAEMRCENNRNLITSKENEDFVVATDLSSMMLAQITNDIRRTEVFTELLDEIGSEAYMKSIKDLGLVAKKYTYSELQSSLYAYDYILIGIKKANEKFKVLTNTNDLIELDENDSIIIIGEE